jgi:hypothetical protein
MSRAQTAAKVAAHKNAHPELYCPDARCLWRTGGGRCPRHGGEPSREPEAKVREGAA